LGQLIVARECIDQELVANLAEVIFIFWNSEYGNRRVVNVNSQQYYFRREELQGKMQG